MATRPASPRAMAVTIRGYAPRNSPHRGRRRCRGLSGSQGASLRSMLSCAGRGSAPECQSLDCGRRTWPRTGRRRRPSSRRRGPSPGVSMATPALNVVWKGCAVGGVVLHGAELGEQALHQADDLRLRQLLDQDRELLAAVAADVIGLAQAPAQEGGQRGEHAVAHRVAVPVVHGLEVVEVDHHPGHRAAGVLLLPRVQAPARASMNAVWVSRRVRPSRLEQAASRSATARCARPPSRGAAGRPPASRGGRRPRRARSGSATGAGPRWSGRGRAGWRTARPGAGSGRGRSRSRPGSRMSMSTRSGRAGAAWRRTARGRSRRTPCGRPTPGPPSRRRPARGRPRRTGSWRAPGGCSPAGAAAAASAPSSPPASRSSRRRRR